VAEASLPKVALIPGGARGIGRAVALALARDGWRVALAYRTSAAGAEAVAAAAQQEGAEALPVQADVSQPAEAERLVGQVLARWGRIDALINAAGPYHRVNLLDESVPGWHEMFDNNLHPVFYTIRAVTPAMAQQGWGRIVNFSVVNADRVMAHPNITAYAIANTGVLILTRSYAQLLGPQGVTVNAVSPGYIDTGPMASGEAARLAAAIPAGYVGAPEDAVGAVRFLLSDEARYVNGANIQVSGGWGV
jgi:3-oxoacyl-[acyl-carrier protein] reductase